MVHTKQIFLLLEKREMVQQQSLDKPMWAGIAYTLLIIKPCCCRKAASLELHPYAGKTPAGVPNI